MSYINVNIDLYDVFEEISNEELINELRKRIGNKSIDVGLLKNIPVVITEQYSSNLIDDMKLKDIIPNLWRRTPEEIEQFFIKA